MYVWKTLTPFPLTVPLKLLRYSQYHEIIQVKNESIRIPRDTFGQHSLPTNPNVTQKEITSS